MRVQLLPKWMLIGFGVLASCLGAAETPSVLTPPLLIGGLRPIDAAFDIRFDLYSIKHGDAKGFQLLEREFQRDPRAHIKARYAEYLIEGKHWGAPEGQAERGWALANEALLEGSVHAWRVVGWERFRGVLGPLDPQLGLELLLAAADLGNANAIVMLGDIYLQGRSNVPANLERAEECFRRGARLGKPYPLFRLGQHYETKVTPPNMAKAAELYYEAATRGSGSARDRLKELAKAKDPAGLRAHHLRTAWFAAASSWGFTTPVVREAVQALEREHADDTQVQLVLARAYVSGNYGLRDFKKAHALLEAAITKGSDEARADRAMLYADGVGVKKDAAFAIRELRALEEKGNPRALALIGYYHYWGLFDRGLLPKDEEKAFQYSRKAADAGDFTGQANTGACFEFGIGTKVDYALAAYYYRPAAWAGHRRADEQLPKLIAFVEK